MKIGGYFNFDIEEIGSLPYEGLYFNSGSSALEFYLRKKKVRRVYLPEYICRMVKEKVQSLGINFSEYQVDEQLYPKIDPGIFSEKGSRVLIVNYFGVRDDLFAKYESQKDKVIYDLAQAFFYNLSGECTGFYSPRKFLGLTDGGILMTPTELKIPKNLNKTEAHNKINHLIKRMDRDPEFGFRDYQKAEERLNKESILRMSLFSEKILKSTNYQKIKKKRKENFKTLHRAFSAQNLLNISLENCQSPLVYPLKLDEHLCSKLRKYLDTKNVYTATYWPEFLKADNKATKVLSNSILALPIDQRWGFKEMEHIIHLIQKYYDEQLTNLPESS